MKSFLLALFLPFLLFSLDPPFIELKAIYDKEGVLYPGQRAWVGYRIRFNRSIDLTVEELPLIHAEGFKRLGEPQIKDSETNGVTTHQIIQRVEALQPGRYVFGPSRVQGYSYTTESSGGKIYQKPLLTGEVGKLEIIVEPFPSGEKPLAFRGAVGQFSLSAALEGSDQAQVGMPVKVKVEIAGTGDLETLMLPDLCCQPGFSGAFSLSDLPPEVDIEAKRKTFHLEITPLNGFIEKIPPIHFAFFDLANKKYGQVASAPIPLNVQSEPLPPLEISSRQPVSAGRYKEPGAFHPAPLSYIDLFLAWWDGRQLLAFIPISCALVLFGLFVGGGKRKFECEALLKKTWDHRDRESFFALAEKTLIAAKKEGKVAESAALDGLLLKLQERRFGSGSDLTAMQVLEEIDRLWEK